MGVDRRRERGRGGNARVDMDVRRGGLGRERNVEETDGEGELEDGDWGKVRTES
jgi:hypothetical protein